MTGPAEHIKHQVVDVARGMWQRRWVGVAVAWVVAVVALIAVAKTPERYAATARVFVDTQTILRPLISGLAVEPDVDQMVGMLARRLITRPNIEQLLAKANNYGFAVESDADRDRLVDSLRGQIQLSLNNARENLFVISYRDTDPQRAERVVQDLVDLFVRLGRTDKTKDGEDARRFIDEQIQSYELKLSEAEGRLKEFKLRNIGLSDGSTGGQDYFTRMSAASEQLATLRADLRAAEEARDALRRELAAEEPLIGQQMTIEPDQVRASPELEVRIDAVRREVDDLLRKYTDEHPDVAASKRLLARLEAQRAQELEARRKAAAPASSRGGTISNPVYQGLKISLAESEANVASLRARVNELQRRLGEQKVRAERVPKVEAEAAQLNRDYDVIRRNYEALVAKREAAAITHDVDAQAMLAVFRVIDPPHVLPNPVFPGRTNLLLAAFLGSIGAGLLAAFAAAQFLPIVQDLRSLRLVTNRPVLGSLSLWPTESAVRVARMDRMRFAGAVSGLMAVFVAGLMWAALGVHVLPR